MVVFIEVILQFLAERSGKLRLLNIGVSVNMIPLIFACNNIYTQAG